MTKAERIERIWSKAQVQRKDCAADEDAALEAIAAGDSVRLVGFGSFEAKERKERFDHDPTTGEPVFKTGKQLKDAVNTT